MKTKILIVNTEKIDPTWLDYIEELSYLDFDMSLLSSDPLLQNFFKIRKLDHKNYKAPFNPAKNNLLACLFLLSRPLTNFLALARILNLKFSKKINTIVCFSSFEKLHFSFWAHLFKIKVVWICSPNEFQNQAKISQLLLKNLSKKANVVCLSKKCQELLESDKFKFKNISHIPIGIRDGAEQKNIFESLAKNTTQVKKKNFFTVGTIGDLDADILSLEKLLHAVKNSLSMIPHIQLIIAGDGEGRKKLAWMAKKMEINNLVWFVGSHRNPQKWLSNFDLFISTNTNPSLKDLQTILLAQSTKLSVIAPSGSGLSEYIKENNGVLFDPDKNTELSDAIIRLEQDHVKRKRFGENAQKHVFDNFKLHDTISKLAEILK